MSWRAELEAIRRERWRMKNANTVAGVALYEQAIRLCDTHRAIDEAFEERSGLMNAVYYTGDWDKLLVQFGWCLAQHDRDPERFPSSALLWKYKWVVNEAPQMPQIGRERIMGLLGDLDRRFRTAGSTMRAVHLHRAYTLIRLGDTGQVEPVLADLETTPRDWLSDCLACESDGRAWILDVLGHEQAAFERRLAVIHGAQECDAVPHSTHSSVLQILWRTGERERAMHHHRVGYGMTRNKRKLIESHAEHIAFAAAADLDHEVAPLLERHLPAAVATPSIWNRLYFYAAARFALRRLVARGRDALAIRLPESVAVDSPSGTNTGTGLGVATAALAAWFTAEIDAGAAAFDRRNGNDYTSKWIAQFDEKYAT